MQATDGAPSAPGFIGRLIAFSGRSPWFVVLMVLALSVWGWYSLRGGALDAIPVAFLVLVIGLALGGTTGYAINPARDLAPRIMHALLPIPGGKGSSDWGYAWIPVVGPLVGGAIAAGIYNVAFA